MANKIYIIENLGCANCAAKMEAKINALPQVESATITFATRQLRVTAENPDALVSEMQKIVQSIEAPTKIVPYSRSTKKAAPTQHAHHEHGHCGCGHNHHEHEHCGCGHDHHEHEHCGCSHDHHEHEHAHEHAHDHGHEHHHGEEDPRQLLLGAGLFVAGLVLHRFPIPFLSYATMGVLLAAYVILGLPVLRTAAGNLTKGHVFDENFLMSIATIGALLIGEFPEAVGVMLFYRVGEYFEHKAVERSRSQIMEAIDLRPETVLQVHGDHTNEIPAEDAKVGDLLLVRPGDRIPLDAVVVSGESRIDTAPITGEPVPVYVGVGDKVISGCVNTAAPLTMDSARSFSTLMVRGAAVLTQPEMTLSPTPT